MALGLFSSLVVGLIIKTIGLQTELWFGINTISTNLVTLGSFAMTYLGAAIGVAVAYKLEAPAYVLFTSLITGSLGAVTGGPAGAFISALIGAEVGKAVSNETKLDLIVTPAVTMITGYLVSLLVSPAIGQFMTFLGNIIIYATSVQPLLTGMIIAVVVGLALSGPISSAALAIMLGLSGLAAGAATAGCAAHMIGFAFMSYKENKMGGLVSQGLGTSKLQLPNIVKNPRILIPPVIASIIGGALATTVFMMENVAAGAGMGTSGLVGPIMTLQTMGFTWDVGLKVLFLYFLLPIIIVMPISLYLRKINWIRPDDLNLHLD